MANILSIFNKIVVYLGRPTEESVSLPDLLEVLYGRIDHYRVLLGIANTNWLVGKFTLHVDPSTDEYDVTGAGAGDMARPIYAETFDQSLPNFVRRPINISRLQNAALITPDISNPTNFAASSYYKHTAQALEFYGFETQQIICRVIPQPIAPCDYRIWYETGKADDPGLQDSPRLMPEFHDMLAVHTAWLLLPNAKWYDQKNAADLSTAEKEGFNAQRFQERMAVLEPELARLNAAFETYRRNNKQERARVRKEFNSYRGSNTMRRRF